MTDANAADPQPTGFIWCPNGCGVVVPMPDNEGWETCLKCGFVGKQSALERPSGIKLRPQR